uniref:Proteasome subunit alpha type-3 n=1 Tax=Sinocyclocheilus rhinocerous TaxID=307959 RepID=A0A673MDS9_9TELE
ISLLPLQYDLSASTFSPDGRVFQVEYAIKAVENSSTAVGIRCKDGVVFGVEKLVLSKLYEEGSNKRIFNIDRHVGMAVAGLLADARSLSEVSREEASNFRSNYGHDIPLKHLADRVAMYVHAYTLYSAVRPFGCSFILGSYDEDDGPQLYMVDPSGISYGYWGCAIGKARQAAKTEIEKLQMKEMTCRELVKEVAKIIYIVHDEVKDKAFELELSWVGEVTKGRHELVPKDIKEEAEKYAKVSNRSSGNSHNKSSLQHGLLSYFCPDRNPWRRRMTLMRTTCKQCRKPLFCHFIDCVLGFRHPGNSQLYCRQ